MAREHHDVFAVLPDTLSCHNFSIAAVVDGPSRQFGFCARAGVR
jgi:hypothetical protein